MTDRIKIGSFGCGIDSVCGLALWYKDFDEWIFCDTGSEKPETYEYMQYLENKGYNITVMKSHLGAIYDYYYNKETIPSRQKRDCTSKFKIAPFREYIRNTYPKDTLFDIALFFDYSELERMHDSNVSYARNIFPLIENKITRDRCVKIIQEHGLDVPVKSGCYFCPFTRKIEWQRLQIEHPELWNRSLELENNALKRNITGSLRLINYDVSKDDCGCFTGI